MGKILLMLAVSLLLCSASCKKKEKRQVDPLAKSGSFYISIEGVDIFQFEGIKVAQDVIDGTHTILFTHYDKEGIGRINLGLRYIRFESQKQRLYRNDYTSEKEITNPSTHIFTFDSDGDVLGDSYHIHEQDSASNFILFKEVDYTSGWMRGVINATYTRDTTNRTFLNFPDTLRLVEVPFEFNIK